MTVIKVNAITVPDDSGDEFAQRLAAIISMTLLIDNRLKVFAAAMHS